MRSLVILISGAGSNMAAIVQTAERERWAEHLNARVAAVISNRADAGGLAFAKEHAIPTAVLSHKDFAQHAQPREAFDAALQTLIDPYQPFLVVLAGFMRILTPGFVQHYDQRLLNIHPSLLPAFAGLHTHERAIEAGCLVSIDSDAHRVEELGDLRWGVDQARRAWAEPRHVLNTRSQAAQTIWRAVDALTEPLLRPIRSVRSVRSAWPCSV